VLLFGGGALFWQGLYSIVNLFKLYALGDLGDETTTASIPLGPLLGEFENELFAQIFVAIASLNKGIRQEFHKL
jgi:hypothetical protein